MKIVCSFCNAEIKAGESPVDPVSHGVCKSCYTRIFEDFGFNMNKFLDLLEAPVFLVDRDVNILSASTSALAMVEKPAPLIIGHLCGEVLRCINASRPKGCGKTEFCPDCTFRNTVNETYKTGQPVTRRPAILVRKSEKITENINILVSTRKDGKVVLLRLEPLAAE